MKNYQKSLINKLGWNDMDENIAIEAIDTILSHHIGMICDVTGDIETPENVAEVLVANWSPDDIFGLLLMDDFMKYEGSQELSQFISLRNEIEFCMRNGLSYQESIDEWYK